MSQRQIVHQIQCAARRRCLTVCVRATLILVAFILVRPVHAQLVNARRMGMGSVVTSDDRSQGASNVAFRAVPNLQKTVSIPLPLGWIPFAGDVPTLDTGDDEFDVYRLANVVMNPPWNLSLHGPSDVSSDIVIWVAQNTLVIDLQDLKRVVPDDELVEAVVSHLPGAGADIGPVYLHAYPLVHISGSFDASDELREALAQGTSIEPNTTYRLMADARIQTAIAVQADLAFQAYHDRTNADATAPTDPSRDRSTALYMGVGPKYLMGLGFADADAVGTAVAHNVLFSPTDPLSFQMDAMTRLAQVGGDGGIGQGYGMDMGAVFFWNNVEIGFALNDVASELNWKPTVRRHHYDDDSDKFVTDEIARGEGRTFKVPVTTTLNLAKRIGATTLAADLVHTEVRATVHAGVEHWFNNLAARGGVFRDQNRNWQYAIGAGKRYGRLGFDIALATHSRNIALERELELAVSITRY